jgi:hypothetical protein
VDVISPSRPLRGRFGGYDVPTCADSLLHGMEDIMDDKEKSLFDSFADTIKHTFDIAAEAASKALEPEPLRPDEELVVIPTPPDAFVSEPSPPMVAIVKKKLRKKSALDTSGRITPDYDIPMPDKPMPSPKKGAEVVSKRAKKKPAKKAPAKKASKKTVKKPGKKTAKKSAKNSKAKSSAKKKAAPTVTKKKKAKKSKR